MIFLSREEENLKIVEEKYESNQFSCIRIITNLFIAICNIYKDGAHHDPARVKCCNLHVDHLLESTLGLLHVLSRSTKNAEFISNKVFEICALIWSDIFLYITYINRFRLLYSYCVKIDLCWIIKNLGFR